MRERERDGESKIGFFLCFIFRVVFCSNKKKAAELTEISKQKEELFKNVTFEGGWKATDCTGGGGDGWIMMVCRRRQKTGNCFMIFFEQISD